MSKEQAVSGSWTGHSWSAQVHTQHLTTSFKVVVPESWRSVPYFSKEIFKFVNLTASKLETSTMNGNTTYTLTMPMITPIVEYELLSKLVNALDSVALSMEQARKD